MALNQVMFFILAALIMICSVLTIFSTRILRSAFYLLSVLVATGGLYFMLNYEFMAGVQLALYAGGIVVLIIFSILLTSHISQKLPKPQIINLISGIAVAIAGFFISVSAILKYTFKATTNPAAKVDMQLIGTQLLGTGKNNYALPFEVISILLLAAMIGAIIIAKKGKEQKEKEKGNEEEIK